MARFTYGGGVGDFTTAVATVQGVQVDVRAPGLVLEVRRRDTQAAVSDVVVPPVWDGQPFPTGMARSDATGRVVFQGPDGLTATLEVRQAARPGFAAGGWFELQGQPGGGGGGSAPVDLSGLVTKVELERRVGGTFSITAYGAEPGAADCTAALRRAAAAAAPSRGVVTIPPGTWRAVADSAAAVLDLPQGVSLSGDGAGTSELVVVGNAVSAVRVHNPPPAFDSPTTWLMADSAIGATTLTVQSTAGLAPGMDVLVGHARAMASLSENRYEGEWVRIRRVDAANGVLTLFGKMADPYLVSAGARLWVYPLWAGHTVRDLTIRHENRVRDSSRTELLTVRGAAGLVVDNVHLADGGGPGCGLHYVRDFTVSGLVVDNLRDFESDGSRWFGYGLYFGAGVENGSVSGCGFRQMRHAITTVGQDGHAGEPRGIVIDGCIATECTLAAFDTHAEGSNITFASCHVHDTGEDAFVLRCRGGRVIGCTVDGAQRGVYVPEQRVTNAVVQGSTFQNITAHGIEVAWWGVGRLRVIDNTFDRLGGAGLIVPRGVSRVTVQGNAFLNFGQRFAAWTQAIRFIAGAQVASAPDSSRTTDVAVIANVFGQDQGVGRTLRAVVVDSDAGVVELLVAQNSGWRMASDWMQTSAATTATVAASNQLFALTA